MSRALQSVPPQQSRDFCDWLLGDALPVGELDRDPSVCHVDTFGNRWRMVDFDGRVHGIRKRALPESDEHPAAKRRSSELAQPGYPGRKRGEVQYHRMIVQDAGTMGGVQDPLAQLDPQADETGSGGLVRRSLDRAATAQAANTGNLSMLNQTGELLAPEITGIEFSYWDGVMWQVMWSSDEYGELPLAVQVKLYMVDPVLAATQGADSLASITPGSDSVRVFSHIVRLPMARPVEEEEEDELAGAGL